jgi:hypothetical protein
MDNNCGAWVIAHVLGGIPVRVAELVLRKYAGPDWLTYDSAGGLDTVAMPHAAIAVLKTMGLDVTEYAGPQQHTVAEWAMRSRHPRYCDSQLILTVDVTEGEAPHALVAERGRVLDSSTPLGLSGGRHRYAPRPVKNVLRVRPGE